MSRSHCPGAVVVSLMPATVAPAHAGGVLLREVVRSYQHDGFEVTVLSIDSVSNRKELSSSEELGHQLLMGRPRSVRGVHRLVLTLAHRLVPPLQHVDIAQPQLPLLVDLLVDQGARQLLARASVVDLQWEQNARLAPLIRRLAPHAVITAMLHDVLEQVLRQRIGRLDGAGARILAHLQWRWNRLVSRGWLRSVDSVHVLSDKDAKELRRAAPDARPVVASPPIATPSTPLHHVAGRSPVLGFISSLARPENSDAAIWLVEEIWPLVKQELPEAELLIVGRGMPSGQADHLARSPGVTVTGFVDDLESVYRHTRACVIPLRQGAGVKFKAIEALVRGVPTVTTPVGAEGIAEEWFSAIATGPVQLAAAITAALSDDGVALQSHDMAQQVRRINGVEAFRDAYQTPVRGALENRLTGGL